MSELDRQQLRAIIDQKLIKTGEKDKLREYLRLKLIECGWRDELKAYCKDIIRSKGLEHITLDDLITEITPKGRSMVPENIKAELMSRIRKFLQENEA